MNPLQTPPLLAAEKRAIAALGALMGARMLGLFVVLPVFALYGAELGGASPAMVGVAIGVYGLTQAAMQIPFGMLSDRFGRKPVLLAGLTLFLLGGLVAASADHIVVVIIGRAIQGAGAIASVVMATVADATREEQRTKAMALIGMSIGASFVLALVIGPLLVAGGGLQRLFLATSALALLGILIVLFVLPDFHAAQRRTAGGWRLVLHDLALRRVTVGVFILHWVMTAVFLALPIALLETHQVAAVDHGWVYLPTMVLSFLAMIPLLILGEKKSRVVWVMRLAVLAMILAEIALALGHASLGVIVGALFAFFFGFNLLEALLPSLVSKLAPLGQKGATMGVYSSSQFLGAFVGGISGGFLSQFLGLEAVFTGSAAVLLLWLFLLLRMPEPPRVTSVTVRLLDTMASDSGLEERLLALDGVEEVVIYPEDGVMIMKADRKKLDPLTLQAALEGKTVG